MPKVYPIETPNISIRKYTFEDFLKDFWEVIKNGEI